MYSPGSTYYSTAAIDAPLADRLTFIRRTYLHLAGAIALFVVLSAALYQAGVGAAIVSWLGGSRFGWLLILGAFVIVGYLASSMAAQSMSKGAQYLGLTLYTGAQALIFSPLIFIASAFYPGVLPTAALVTLATFGGLSVYVLTSNKDFSFLRSGLAVGFILALGLIVAGVIFGFHLGIWFSGAMILLASGSILYSTSRVLHQFRTDQHVSAALELFAALAILFWYVLRLFMELRR
jgi:FtsH-binding integral membrane protein